MKNLSLQLAALVLALTASAATPELSGIYIEGGKALFVLVNPDTGASSRWLALGQDFDGFKLKEFRSDASTLVLTKDGQDESVRLRDSKVKYAATTLSGTIELGAGGSTQVQRATLVFDEETTFPVADGITLTLKPTLRKDGTVAYVSRFEQTGPDGRKQVLEVPTVVSLPGHPFSVRIGNLGFALKP